MFKKLIIGLIVIVCIALYGSYLRLCLFSPVNPDVALEYKTLLANEILKETQKGE